MAKAHIHEDRTIHQGDFVVSIWIDCLVLDLTIDDVIFTSVSGNGITGVIPPDALKPIYIEEPYHTLFSMHVEVPDGVVGSFTVHVREREYTLDNMREGYLDHHHIVSIPEIEMVVISNSDIPVFRYNT